MDKILSIIASLFTLTSVSTYFRQVVKNQSIPNPATWLIWLVITFINAATYFEVVNRNTWSALVSIVLASGIAIVFAFSLFRGKFSKLGNIEIVALAGSLIIGTIWRISGNAVLANLALQVVLIISFIPTFIGLKRGYLKERPLPWFSASIAYILLIFVLLINNSYSLAALMFPLISLILNGSVGIIATKK